MKAIFFLLLLLPIISLSDNNTDSLVVIKFYPNWNDWCEINIDTDEKNYTLNITITNQNNVHNIDLTEKSQIDTRYIILIEEFFRNYNYTQDTGMLLFWPNENGDTVIIMKDRTDNRKRLYVFGKYYGGNDIRKFNFRKPLTKMMDIELIELIFKICYESLTENKTIEYIKELETELKK